MAKKVTTKKPKKTTQTIADITGVVSPGYGIILNVGEKEIKLLLKSSSGKRQVYKSEDNAIILHLDKSRL